MPSDVRFATRLVIDGVSFVNVSNESKIVSGEELFMTKAFRALTHPKMNEDVMDIHNTINAQMYIVCAFFFRSFPGVASGQISVNLIWMTGMRGDIHMA